MSAHPVATYRFQLTPGFGFAAVVEQLDHLVALGVSHVYLSPVAEANTGSTHGYDVVDHRRVRWAELGGEQGLVALLDAAGALGLGVLVDHVPNHVSVAHPHLNPRWWALLRDGPDSEAARWFDVDWNRAGGRVVVPQLGDPIDDVVASGGFEVAIGDLGPELRYGPLRYPLAPGTEDLPLAEALRAQHYALTWWRDPTRNVRRFFTIDELAGVRVSDPDVSHDVDSIPRTLSTHPAFAGVRVDHVDGLADPRAYLAGLRATIGDDRWLLVEKIVAPGEWLPDGWPVEGTTGYEHIRVVEHALLDPRAEAPLVAFWQHLTADSRTFDEQSHGARREVLDGGLRPDVERLARQAALADPDDDQVLVGAFTELTLAMPRYRTYLPDDPGSEGVLDAALARASRLRPDLTNDLDRASRLVRDVPAVRTRWQQLTGAAMAKGAEDCAYYRFHPLAALCEVGGTPGRFGLSAADFHLHQIAAQRRSPRALLAATTHDTKRSEHVRARSLALAELAGAWTSFVERWIGAHRELVEGRRLLPRRVLLALETVVTAEPITVERLTDYLVKAGREAELRTTWTDPDDRYEEGLRDLAAVLVEEIVRQGALSAFAAATRVGGWRFALCERTVRATAPGVPDLYQGSLGPLLSLVDPDNRRPVDWGEQRARLERATAGDVRSAWAEAADLGLVAATAELLALRRRRPAAFDVTAGYAALDAAGPMAERVLAYARSVAETPEVVVVVCPVDPAHPDVAGTTVRLPDGEWRSVLDRGLGDLSGDVALDAWAPRLPALVLEPARQNGV